MNWHYSTLLGLALVACLFATGCDRPAANSSPQNAPPSPTTPAASAYSALTGKWARSDGDYMIAITSVAEDGAMNASYFNPDPIHVGKAQASRADGGIKVVIVLQDANYPGSTYTLAYDVKTDRLVGTYYQAVAKETYEVFFVREPAGGSPSK